MNTPSLVDYLSFDDAKSICKLAADENDWKRKLKVMGTGALGLATGTLAGAGGAHLANKAYNHINGTDIPYPYLMAALPVLGGGLGLLYNMAKARELEEMKRVVQSPADNAAGSPPGR
jgi:hypothetical protein